MRRERWSGHHRGRGVHTAGGGVHTAGNGLDATRTDALLPQLETGKINCVHLPRCGRLSPGVCVGSTPSRPRSFVFGRRDGRVDLSAPSFRLRAPQRSRLMAKVGHATDLHGALIGEM
jgi:hypothetical protein